LAIKEDHIFQYPQEFILESGATLPDLQLKYTTLGQLNHDRNNVIWVCHALTGSSDFTDWWHGLFTDDSPFHPDQYFIICANMPGGCYGSTGPLSINPISGKPYYHQFPEITNRDIIGAFELLRLHLRIASIHTLIGGSMGGQQALEWAIWQPTVFKNLIALACNAFHSPWGIAINEAQRMAIAADPTWIQQEATAGLDGVKAARAMAMISFRTYDSYRLTQAEKSTEQPEQYRAASYQRYQGEKLAHRFNAFSYVLLTKAMDSHQVGRGRKNIQSALGAIQAKTLIVGIEGDNLFPNSEQAWLTQHIPGASLEILSSMYGHDGFLVEFEQVKNCISKFLKLPLKANEVVS